VALAEGNLDRRFAHHLDPRFDFRACAIEDTDASAWSEAQHSDQMAVGGLVKRGTLAAELRGWDEEPGHGLY
jgi:hypothetical protein